MHRRGGLLVAIAVGLATLVFPAATAHAAITTVNCGNTNNDVPAVQSAVNAASNGDLIQLRGTCDFSRAEAAGGEYASVVNAGVVIRPGAPIDGLTIQSADGPRATNIVGSGDENAFFIAPGNNNVKIRGLRFENLGRPVVAFNTKGTIIGDGTDGTTPEAWGNRILGVFGTSSGILGIANDRGVGNPAGTLTIKYGNDANLTASFTIPAGQKLEDFSVLGNFITYTDPGLPPGDPKDIIAIDVRQDNAGAVDGVVVMRNATGFLTDDIPSFGWNAVRVHALKNTATYNIRNVDVVQNNFGLLEEVITGFNDPNKAGRTGILLARVDTFNISNNRVRSIMTPTLEPQPGGGIVTTDSSNGSISLNATINIAHPTTPVTSDLGAYGIVDDLFFGAGGAGGGPPSEHIKLLDNIVGPAVGPPLVGGLHGIVVTGSTDITATRNNVRTSTARALEVAGKVQGLSSVLPKTVIGSGFCGNTLDGRVDDPTEVGFEEDGPAGSYANSLPDGTSVFGNGHCVAPAVIITLTDGDTQVSEDGAFDTYKIRLSLRPTAPVTITLSGGSQLTTAPVSLTFDYSNWIFDQIVTVNAIDDLVFEGTHGGFVVHTVVSADVGFNALVVANVQVIIFDNDPPPPPTAKQIIVTESGGSTDVVEGGANDTYTIVLSAAPSGPGNVQVNVFPNVQVSVFPTSVLFNAANWNIPQTITVSAVNDTVFEGPHTGFIQHASFGGGDPAFEAAPIPGVVVNITDNDLPDLTPPAPPVVSCPILPAGQKSLTLSGTAEPNSIVTVHLNGSPFTQTTANGSGFWSVLVTFTANGTYSITATATDGSGNTSAQSSPACTVTVVADFTPPGAPIILVPVEGAFVGVPTTISGTVDPDATSVEVWEGTIRLGISSVSGGAWAISVSLAEGTHSVRAFAKDAAGNIGPWSAFRNFFVDRTPPTITIIRPPLYLGVQFFLFGNGTLRGTARDNAGLFPSFIDHVTVTYTNLLTGDQTVVTATCTSGCGTGSITWEHHPSLGTGIFTVRAVAFDRVGLASAPANERIIAIAQ